MSERERDSLLEIGLLRAFAVFASLVSGVVLSWTVKGFDGVFASLVSCSASLVTIRIRMDSKTFGAISKFGVQVICNCNLPPNTCSHNYSCM